MHNYTLLANISVQFQKCTVCISRE